MSEASFCHLRMRLDCVLPAPVWPPGVALVRFSPERHAREAHALLATAYTNGWGEVADFEAWWRSVSEDGEYDSDAMFVTVDERGALIGFVHCWCSGFVKDIAVTDAWRWQGVGRALLLHAFAHFRARGAAHVDLKVRRGNPAERLYRVLGMTDASAG